MIFTLSKCIAHSFKHMFEIKNRYIKYQEIFALKDRETIIILQISLKRIWLSNWLPMTKRIFRRRVNFNFKALIFNFLLNNIFISKFKKKSYFFLLNFVFEYWLSTLLSQRMLYVTSDTSESFRKGNTITLWQLKQKWLLRSYRDEQSERSLHSRKNTGWTV